MTGEDGKTFERIYAQTTDSIAPRGPQQPLIGQGERGATMGQGLPTFATAFAYEWELQPFGGVSASDTSTSDFTSEAFGNMLKDLFKELAPKLIRIPHATRRPQELKGQKAWSELVDPVSVLIPETVAPLGPISPETRQRKWKPSLRGKKGISSHINILVDCSISMTDDDFYATLIDKDNRVIEAGGRFCVRFVACLLIEQARVLGDSFSLFTFNNGRVRQITNGPSRAYKEAIEYLYTTDDLYENEQADMPFMANGGTPLGIGLAGVASMMDKNRRNLRGALTFVLCDGQPNEGLGTHLNDPHRSAHTVSKNALFNSSSSRSYAESWDEEGYPNYARDYRGDPLDDEFIRKHFGPVVYIIVGGESNIAQNQDLAQSFNMTLQNHYNGTNYGVAQRSRECPRCSGVGSLGTGAAMVICGECSGVRMLYETVCMLGNDRRMGETRGDWSAWTWATSPPGGVDAATLPRGTWTAPSIRGPCLMCSHSFAIMGGEISIASFAGSLLQMAKSGKAGAMQKHCFTKAKSAL